MNRMYLNLLGMKAILKTYSNVKKYHTTQINDVQHRMQNLYSSFHGRRYC
jgi:hypothetical protein